MTTNLIECVVFANDFLLIFCRLNEKFSCGIQSERVASSCTVLEGKSQEALDDATHQVHEIIDQVSCKYYYLLIRENLIFF